MKKRNKIWRTIKSAPRDGTKIDVWLNIYASPLSFGFSDCFEVQNAWFKDGKWVHVHGGKDAEMHSHYITHWKPAGVEVATGPNGEDHEIHHPKPAPVAA